MGILGKFILGDLMGDLLAGVKNAVEAEGCKLRRSLMGMLVAAQLLLVAVVVLLAGVGFIMWGFYALLAPSVGPWGSAFIVGGAALLASLCLTLYARKMTR